MPGDDLKRRYEHAIRLYDDGKFAEAKTVLDQLAPDHPESRHIAYYRALCALALGDLKEARVLCERMSSRHGKDAAHYVAKIEEKLREREKELHGAHKHSSERSDRPREQHVVPETPNSIPILVAGGCIALIILVIVLAYATMQHPKEASFVVRAFPADRPFHAVGDAFIELTLFCPSGKDQGFQSLVFLAPAKEPVGPAGDEIGDQVGGPVATNWPDIKERAAKALALSGAPSEKINETPRDQMVRTVIIPKSGLALEGSFAGKPLVSFNPGPATTLAAVTSACGQPEREVDWPTVAEVGLGGKTHWWGRVGLATDSSGAITHIMVQACPAPAATAEASSDAPAAT